MPTEHQAKPVVTQTLGKIRVMRKHDDSVCLCSITDRAARVLGILPEIPNPADAKSAVTPLEPESGIIYKLGLRILKRLARRWCTFPVIMVTKDCKAP